MAMPNIFEIIFAENPATPGSVLNGVVADRQVSDMVQGYQYARGLGAVMVAELEGSIADDVWTAIATLDATSQGEIPAYFNRVRVRVTTPGALGTGHALLYGGKS